MNKSIKITSEDYEIVNKLAKQQKRSRKTILSIAIEEFFKNQKRNLKE